MSDGGGVNPPGRPAHRAPGMTPVKVRSDLAPRQRGFGACQGSELHAPPAPSARRHGDFTPVGAVRQYARRSPKSASALAPSDLVGSGAAAWRAAYRRRFRPRASDFAGIRGGDR